MLWFVLCFSLAVLLLAERVIDALGVILDVDDKFFEFAE